MTDKDERTKERIRRESKDELHEVGVILDINDRELFRKGSIIDTAGNEQVKFSDVPGGKCLAYCYCRICFCAIVFGHIRLPQNRTTILTFSNSL